MPTSSPVPARARAFSLAALLAAAVLALPGCSDTTGPSDDDTFTDTRTVNVLEGSFVQFTANRGGTIDASVNWNSGNNDVDAFATQGNCPDLATLVGGGCNIIARAESETARPERLTFSVSSGTTYRVFSLNFGPNADTVTITVTLR